MPICHHRGEGLVDLMGNRRRQLSHREDSRKVSKLGLALHKRLLRLVVFLNCPPQFRIRSPEFDRALGYSELQPVARIHQRLLAFFLG